MKSPTSYYEWVECLNYIKDKPRNDLYIDTLKKGRLDADNNLLMKLIKELANIISYRIENTINDFMEYLQGGVDYNGLSLEIISVRKEFNYAKKLVYINIIPKNISENLANTIQLKANQIQEVLENKTQNADRSGILNSLIKSNPINKLEEIK
ncbi:MAG: hypothetical protein J6X02_03880 [Bacilli bacterium]|nr:hypothetical protein [Bacilli bacterium]